MYITFKKKSGFNMKTLFLPNFLIFFYVIVLVYTSNLLVEY